MWFNRNDLMRRPRIPTDGMCGISIPHAGTAHCGAALSHALRFVPTKMPSEVTLVYEPATDAPDAVEERPPEVHVPTKHAYHEVIVPLRAMLWLWPEMTVAKWSFVNARARKSRGAAHRHSFTIVSCDWSHKLPLQQAVYLENRAVKSLLFDNLHSDAARVAIDSPGAFQQTPVGAHWEWIGRSFSSGANPVGFMSLILRKRRPVQRAYGYFVTAYDDAYRARECLGEMGNPSVATLRELTQRVIRLASQQAPRLDRSLEASPVRHVLVTELHHTSPGERFVRGLHSASACGATYISTVFLEHVMENGTWIAPTQTRWTGTRGPWSFGPTLRRLAKKGGHRCGHVTLYRSRVVPMTIL